MKRDEILRYQEQELSRDTVRRHYLKWREEQGVPIRCDEPQCQFHSTSLEWNSKPFKPILDHTNGVNSDNRPENLRLLCPNCDSQLIETRGGANRGKTEKSSGGFSRLKSDGKRAYTMPAEAGTYVISGQPTRLEILDKDGNVIGEA